MALMYAQETRLKDVMGRVESGTKTEESEVVMAWIVASRKKRQVSEFLFQRRTLSVYIPVSDAVRANN